MIMRTVVWNMAHKARSWKALDGLSPDVALLNEATPTPVGVDAVANGRTIGRDGYDRPWSTAVVSKHALRVIDDARPSSRGRARKVPFENSRPGSWTAALVSVPGVGDLTAISLYGLLDEMSDASVHRSLSEVSPLFDDDRYKRSVLLGGDLNTWTGWSAPSDKAHLARDQAVLLRLEAYGLVDCLQRVRPSGRLEGCPCSLGDDCTHTHTRLDPRYPQIPYQMDYLFASPTLAERLTGCEGLPPAEWRFYSDHSPIVATFED
jgi:endonuclease/exonuclease/phosphatase family metal-dependent hydrolase